MHRILKLTESHGIERINCVPVPAVHHDEAGVRLVKGADLPAEVYDGAGPVGHAVIRPRREVQLLHVARLLTLHIHTNIHYDTHCALLVKYWPVIG